MSPRVVVITGGSSGIGRATALRFAREGWRVGLIARGEVGLQAAAKDVVEAGGTAGVAVADVSDPEALEAAAQTLENQLGPVDVWINNAGVGIWGWFGDVEPADFQRVIEVNLLGTVNGTRVALKRMAVRDRGTVVQIVSAIGFRGIPLQSAYSASKYGVRGFSEAVRAELAAKRSGVHLTLVHPPAVNTPFYEHAQTRVGQAVRPPPPVYQPEPVADAIFFAAQSKRRDVRVGEQSIALALGNAVAPALMDRVTGRLGVPPQLRDGPGNDGDNLRQPSRRPAVHGAFDRESFAWTPHTWLVQGRETAALGLGIAVLALLALGRPRG